MLQYPSSNHAVKGLIRFVSRFAWRVVEVVLQLNFIWYSKLVVKDVKKFREIFFSLNQTRPLILGPPLWPTCANHAPMHAPSAMLQLSATGQSVSSARPIRMEDRSTSCCMEDLSISGSVHASRDPFGLQVPRRACNSAVLFDPIHIYASPPQYRWFYHATWGY